jgi:PAS domain-containing protein
MTAPRRATQQRSKIAGRKRAEEAIQAANAELRETKRYLASLIEDSPDGIIATDREGNVVLFNRGPRRCWASGRRRSSVSAWPNSMRVWRRRKK